VHREQTFRFEGANAGLVALIAMAALSLVLPNFTTSTPGGTYSEPQLAFAAVTSALLWAVYVFVQTVRHRDYFLPADAANDEMHARPPTSRQAALSFGLLLVSLVAVVGLAKILSPSIERALLAAGAPKAVLGILIALLVLLPEACAALRAARADRLQTSMNLAIGSALASIGLTIPVVAIASIMLDLPLVLGLAPKDLVMLVVTFLVSIVTLASVPREHRHARERAHAHDAGRGAPRAFRGVPVSRVRALAGISLARAVRGRGAPTSHGRRVEIAALPPRARPPRDRVRRRGGADRARLARGAAHRAPPGREAPHGVAASADHPRGGRLQSVQAAPRAA
jgi:hypothetical protein